MIQELKKNIDIVPIIESAGMELKQRGQRWSGLCPFHSEKTPSFFVFHDNRFKCFGCGEHGDVIDFVQKFYDFDFKQACRFLGINHQGKITPKIRKEIEQRKRKAEAIRKFEEWRGQYLWHLGTLINKTEKLLKGVTYEDLRWYCQLIDGLATWHYHSDILMTGSDEEKIKLYEDVNYDRIRFRRKINQT